MSIIYPCFFAVARWITAILSVFLVFLWIRYFRSNKKPTSIYAALITTDGLSVNVCSKENIIGRSKNADILLPVRGVAKKHAALFLEKGCWKLAPLEGKVQINQQNLSRPAPLEYGDKITVAGQTLCFKAKNSRDVSSKKPKGAFLPLLVLTIFQIVIFLEIALKYGETLSRYIPVGFLCLVMGQWLYWLIGKFIEDFKMLTELPIFYLSTIGLALGSCHGAEELAKQGFCYGVGFVLFIIFTLLLKFKDFILLLQRFIMLLSVLLLYYTAFFGVVVNSSRNWLKLGPITFQPSELVKAAFVLCGGATLYIIVKKSTRMWEFLIYSVLCMGALGIMLDFGAVAIFFVGMMVVLTLRLAHPLLLGGIAATAVTGALGVIFLYPYVARRFGVWLHAWEYADSTGYQQTRTMIASASGGLLGVGGGNGHLSKVSAAQTDLVFGIVSEEWGGIIAFVVALCFVALGVYALRLAKSADSLFYSITVSASAVMLIFQAALNIFGSLDLLPLTGVTMVFVSRGGTSLIAAWLMFAFFKGAELHKSKIKVWGYEE